MTERTNNGFEKKRAVIVAFTGEGSRLAAFLCQTMRENAEDTQENEWEWEAYVLPRFFKEEWREIGVKKRENCLDEWVKEQFCKADALLFIGATGIAVRAIAPVLKDKLHDPAVLVMDEKANYVIPILSGHVGGANELAKRLCLKMDALPVITTASDVNQIFAVDVFAKKNHLTIWNRNGIQAITSQLLEGKPVGMITEGVKWQGALPKGVKEGKVEGRHIYITPFQRSEWMQEAEAGEAIILIPACLVVGVGCRRGVESSQIECTLCHTASKHQIFLQAVEGLASIDRKKDEKGILELAEKYKWSFETFSAEQLLTVPGRFSESSFVEKTVGVGNVCERAAVYASKGELWIPKTVGEQVTIAVAWSEKRIAEGDLVKRIFAIRFATCS